MKVKKYIIIIIIIIIMHRSAQHLGLKELYLSFK